MRKTFRRVAAMAVFAAMTVAMIPSAFAANEYLMIDEVKINKSMYTTTNGQVNRELKDALDVTDGKYDNNANTFTIKKLPSSMPYTRPYQYTTNYKDELNYGPYLPLTVMLGYWDGGEYIQWTNDTVQIKVDDKDYTLEGTDTSIGLKATILRYLIGEALLNSDDELLVSSSIHSGLYTTDSALYDVLGLAYDDEFARSSKNDNLQNLKDLLPDGYNATNVYYTIYNALYKHPQVTQLIDKMTSNQYNVLMSVIADIANNAARGITTYNVTSWASIQNAVNAYVKEVIAGYDKKAYNTRYVPINVFHYLYNDMYGADRTHTIKVRQIFDVRGVKRYGEWIERKFTVKVTADGRYSVADAKKSLATNAINKDNINVYAQNGAVYFDFAQADVLATDTWRTASTAYKLWDRSNFNLYGGWVSFKDTVKQGDTVFLDADVLLKNSKGEVIPAGTKLTFKFSKQQTVNGSTYQYKNEYKWTVASDNTIPLGLALDFADMYWLYNTHNQQYVEVTFEDGDGNYPGSFMIYTRAVDRITTGAITFDVGNEITMKVGETKTVNALFAFANAMSTDATWTSNAPSIASVAASGTAKQAVVTGNAVGKAVVTVKGNKDDVTGTLIVNVVADTPDPTTAPSGIKTYKVVTVKDPLNVRTGMGTSFKKLGTLSKGATFQGELSAEGDWVKINYNGTTAYVSSKYVIAID